MKKCIYCKIDKQIDEFYLHPQMLDGHLGKCKDCCKKASKENIVLRKNNPIFIENERKRGREKYHRLYIGIKRTPESNKERILKYANLYPEKIAAMRKSGSLKKPFDGLEKHHWSYNKEHHKDVIWLNKKAHNKAHRFIVYDQERKMYRTYDTNILLDTKAIHEEFIRHCIENREE